MLCLQAVFLHLIIGVRRPFYARRADGLLESLLAGIPFFSMFQIKSFTCFALNMFFLEFPIATNSPTSNPIVRTEIVVLSLSQRAFVYSTGDLWGYWAAAQPALPPLSRPPVPSAAASAMPMSQHHRLFPHWSSVASQPLCSVKASWTGLCPVEDRQEKKKATRGPW